MSQVQEGQTRTVGVLHRHGNRLEELQQTLDLHSGQLDRMEGNQHRMEDNQHRQFDHLSAQIAEILNVLRAPATTDPPSESEP